MTTDAFKKNIIPLQSHLQILAERMLGDATDAEDAVQEVFMHLWESRDKLDKVVNIKAYVMQAIRARCIDIIRSKGHSKEFASSDVDATLNLHDLTEEISEEVELTERRSAMLHSMLDDLPEKQRQLIRMRYLEEKEIPEIEKALKMTSSNIYTTISRAIQTLKTKLKNEYTR